MVLKGSDLLLDDSIALTLYRDGRTPAVQGGKFGAAEAMRSSGGVDQPVIWDRLTGGMGATERLIAYTYPLAIDSCTRFGRVWTPGGEIIRLGALPNGAGGRPPGRIRAMCVQGNDLLIGAGGVLVRLVYPYGDANMSVEPTTMDPSEEIRSITLYQGFIVLGTQKVSDGTPGRLYVKDGSTWTRSSNANRQLSEQAYFTVDNQGEWRLAMNDTPYTFKWIATTNSTTLLDDTAWTSISGAGYPVGSRDQPITNIKGFAQVMFHLKVDGLYQVMPDGRAARIADWSNSLHPDNGTSALAMYGGIYASHGRHGLVRVDVANTQIQYEEQACAPGAGFPRVIPIHGKSAALARDGEWMVDVVFNGTDSFVCYGRPTKLASQWSLDQLRSPQLNNWHGSEASFWGQEVTSTLQASIGPANRPLLWVAGLEGSTPVLQNVSLPGAASPLEDWINNGPHRFTTQSWLYLPREDFGTDGAAGWASVRKVFDKLEMNAEYLERYATWIDAYMSTKNGHQIFWDRALDDDTLWSLVGRMDDSDRVSMVPPTSVQSGVKASVMFRGYGEADKPFAFASAKLRGIPILEQAERRRYRVTLGLTRRANLSRDLRSVHPLLSRMLSYQWSDPVSLVDKTNTRVTIKIDEGMSYQEVVDPNTKEPTIMVDFTCRVMRRPFYWGTGYRWGSDITWS